VNQFKLLSEQGAGREELFDFLMEKIHEEKLWVLRQPVVLPGLFRKRAKKIFDLVEDFNISTDGLIEVGQNTNIELNKSFDESLDLATFLRNYDPMMNKFRLNFMNSEVANDLIISLSQMASLEEAYYEHLDKSFDLNVVDKVDTPPNEKLAAFRLLALLESGQAQDSPEILNELQRVKRILSVYRKA